MDGVREHLFARATLTEQPAAAGRNASQSGSLRAAHGVSNHATLTGDVLEPRDVLRAFRRQMLQVAVGVSQEFRQGVNRELKRNVRDPRLARERLQELGRITSLAQQHPHGCHRRCAGTEVQTKLSVAPSRS